MEPPTRPHRPPIDVHDDARARMRELPEGQGISEVRACAGGEVAHEHALRALVERGRAHDPGAVRAANIHGSAACLAGGGREEGTGGEI